MHLVLKLSSESRDFPNVVVGKIVVPNRDAHPQTVVIVDAMQ